MKKGYGKIKMNYCYGMEQIVAVNSFLQSLLDKGVQPENLTVSFDGDYIELSFEHRRKIFEELLLEFGMILCNRVSITEFEFAAKFEEILDVPLLGDSTL